MKLDLRIGGNNSKILDYLFNQFEIIICFMKALQLVSTQKIDYYSQGEQLCGSSSDGTIIVNKFYNYIMVYEVANSQLWQKQTRVASNQYLDIVSCLIINDNPPDITIYVRIKIGDIYEVRLNSPVHDEKQSTVIFHDFNIRDAVISTNNVLYLLESNKIINFQKTLSIPFSINISYFAYYDSFKLFLHTAQSGQQDFIVMVKGEFEVQALKITNFVTPSISDKIFPFSYGYSIKGTSSNRYFILYSDENVNKLISKDLEYIQMILPAGFEINGLSEKNATIFYKNLEKDLTCISSYQILDQKLTLTGEEQCFIGDLKYQPAEQYTVGDSKLVSAIDSLNYQYPNTFFNSIKFDNLIYLSSSECFLSVYSPSIQLLQPELVDVVLEDNNQNQNQTLRFDDPQADPETPANDADPSSSPNAENSSELNSPNSSLPDSCLDCPQTSGAQEVGTTNFLEGIETADLGIWVLVLSVFCVFFLISIIILCVKYLKRDKKVSNNSNQVYADKKIEGREGRIENCSMYHLQEDAPQSRPESALSGFYQRSSRRQMKLSEDKLQAQQIRPESAISGIDKRHSNKKKQISNDKLQVYQIQPQSSHNLNSHNEGNNRVAINSLRNRLSPLNIQLNCSPEIE